MADLIITVGITAAGKSTIASHVAASLDLLLIPEAAFKRTLQPQYLPEHGLNEQLRDLGYAAAEAVARTALMQNRSVIIDASFVSQSRRLGVYQIARTLGVPMAILHVGCSDPGEIGRRLARRRENPSHHRDHAYDPIVHDYVSSIYEPLTRSELRSSPVALVVDVETAPGKVHTRSTSMKSGTDASSPIGHLPDIARAFVDHLRTQ